jgi:hypothetical protein
VVVGLHGVTEQAGEQEHERVADDPPPRKPSPAPGKSMRKDCNLLTC